MSSQGSLDVLEATYIEIEREACHSRFYEFFLSFWEVVSNEPLALNWHHEYLCDELQKLSHYIVNRLPKPYDTAINIPPGTTKSTICSQMWPVWLWTQDASIKVITNSHSASLSIEHAIKSRDIIESEKFNRLFPDIVLRSDKAAKGFYENTSLGARYATSTGSSAIGFHAHVIIHDDPSDPKEEFSEPLIKQVIEKIKELSTRKVNKLNTPTVTIMQRLHEADATGYLLKTDPNLHHICLPAELSDKVKPTSLKSQYINGLLDPIRQSYKVLDDALRELGSAKYSGQYAQSPVQAGGNIIKEEWFTKCTYDYLMSIVGATPFHYFVDTAFTDKNKNDPTGVITVVKVGNYLYIVNAHKVRMKFPDLIRFLPTYVKQWFYTNRSTIRIEPKANGKSVVDELKDKSMLNVMETPPPLGSKEERLNAKSATVEAHRIILVEGSWNDEFIGEVCGFPYKEHDEFVDLLCYAIDLFFTNDTVEKREEIKRQVLQVI